MESKVELFKDKSQLESKLVFLVTKSGVMRVQNNEVFRANLHCSKVPQLLELKEGLVWKNSKIPAELFYQIVGFFRKHDSEVYAQIFWSREEKKYYVFIPEQCVSQASIEVKNDYVKEQTDLLVLEVHSHNRMGAFFSSIDNSDEKRLCIYGVISFKSDNIISMWRLKCGDDLIELQFDEIFEFSYPKFWDKNIKSISCEHNKLFEKLIDEHWWRKE